MRLAACKTLASTRRAVKVVVFASRQSSKGRDDVPATLLSASNHHHDDFGETSLWQSNTQRDRTCGTSKPLQRSSPNAAPTFENRDPAVRHHSESTMALLWRGYCQALQRHPFKVKAATSGCTFATTDAIAQSRDDKPYDWTATARNASFGVLWLGPANHLFWGRTVGLERWFPGHLGPTSSNAWSWIRRRSCR